MTGRDRVCIACGAAPGQPCMTPSGKPAKQEHADRGYSTHYQLRKERAQAGVR